MLSEVIMNTLYLIVTSNLNNKSDFIRFAESVDISENITVLFINQSSNLSLKDIYQFKKSNVMEIKTYKSIPLSNARNLALKKIYTEEFYIRRNALIMFTDDDAWFPLETLHYLLECQIKAFSLKTKDPISNKSFSKVKKISGEIKGWHLVHDIVSICLVLPLHELVKTKLYFNEKLGLGNKISQGEESLFIYELSKTGVRIYYDTHIIYHPYKKTFNIKNFYSMAYFWAFGFSKVSPMFLLPLLKYTIKYSIALGLVVRDQRYFKITINVWKGILDGIKDTEKILSQ